eukprot:CAMPEP_0114282234 /NCGR_PEP_ID=MMETSP0059-20121206/3445_1 /TAXON_ID=36894 /ORGANISM="Pyramimonas parkeae, Strain CCMP726" /LENGTH=71 /DNA_ID=CAMNT_0001402853 /DNA_START=452 /DNA_END=667 /DNA_ORIENTATION=-
MTESCCARLYVGKGNAGRVRQVETGLDAAGGDGTELRARHQLFQLESVVLPAKNQRHLAVSLRLQIIGVLI